MYCMVVTLAVFHEPMLPLKAVAPMNMYCMVVTLAVFHAPMSWLKAEVPYVELAVGFMFVPTTG